MPAPVRIAVLGTGNMGRAHVEAYRKMPGAEVVAGIDAREDALNAFCDGYGIAERYTTLTGALAAGSFDAVSNVTPDGAHYSTTLLILGAGKHVLCEKPLSTDYGRALEMTAAARDAGVVNMVNLSYRNVPALQKAAALVAQGAIGNVRHFEASYLQSWLTQPAWGDWKTESAWLWRLSTQHGSKGVLGDVGIHILDYATFVTGAFPRTVSARLQTFHKAPLDRIGEYPLDANDSFVMHTQLDNGAIGTISATRFASGHHNDLRLRLYGDTGGLEVLWEKNVSTLRGCLGTEAMVNQRWTELDTPPVPTVYERFVAAIRGDGPMEPDFVRGAQLQQVLDLAERSDQLESRALHTAPVDLDHPDRVPNALMS